MWNVIPCVMCCQHLCTPTIYKYSFLHHSLTVNSISGVGFQYKACNFTSLADFSLQEIFLNVNHQICTRTVSSRGSRDSSISLKCTDEHLIKSNFRMHFLNELLPCLLLFCNARVFLGRFISF